MRILDFGRSFIHGKNPENSVRFWVESMTRVIDERHSLSEDFYQCGACKSEYTFADRSLLVEDNFDFLPIFGPTQSLIFRRHAYITDGYRDTKPSEALWKGQVYRLSYAENTSMIDDNERIRDATHNDCPIVAITEIWDENSELRAIIQYPVKTMNIHDQRNLYQVDTGPIAWPDLSKRRDNIVDMLWLAFVVFNANHFADFVIEVPTGSTHHYSKIVSLQARNTLYSVDDTRSSGKEGAAD